MSANAHLRPFVPDQPTIEQPLLFEARPLTVRQVVDWYAVNNVRPYNAEAERERKRIRQLFCSWPGPQQAEAACYGDWPVTQCRGADLLEFLNRQAPEAAWTRKRWCITVQTPFNCAAKLGLIGRNPFRGVSLPEGNEGRDLSDAEWRALLRLATPEFRRVLVWLRFSGCRPGELRVMRWEHVNFDAQAVILKEHKTAHTLRERQPRRIAFNPVLVKLLLWLGRNEESDYVFTNSQGQPWQIRSLCKRLAGLRSRAGLPDDAKLYGCRHAYATFGIVNGVDVATLAQLLGHKHLRTTQRYLHLAAKFDHLNAAAEQAVRKKRS